MKKTRTFSISEEVWDKFSEIVEKNKINRSKLIESYIKKFNDENDTNPGSDDGGVVDADFEEVK